MTTDELARHLTRVLRETDGVAEILPMNRVMHEVSEGIAATLELPEPESFVEVDEADGFTTVTAHIGTSAGRPAPETLRAAAANLRNALTEHEAGLETGHFAINVKAGLIHDGL